MTLTFYYAKNSAAYGPHILLEDVGVVQRVDKVIRWIRVIHCKGFV